MLVKKLRKFFQKLTSRASFRSVSISDIPILIPARAGSKRIPNKNLAALNGAPLLYYSITECKKVSKTVVVSSDSQEILDYASLLGAAPLLRSSHLAKDDTSSEDVLLHFLKNFDTDIAVLVQPTSPLVRSIDVSAAISLYLNGSYDSVTTMVPFRGKLHFRDSEKGLKKVDFKEKTGQENKDLVLYRETGAVYVTSSGAIFSGSRCINGRVGIIEVPLKFSIDIDEPEDLELADIIMKGQLFV